MSLHASLAQQAAPMSHTAQPWLDPRGARVVLGTSVPPDRPAAPIRPAAGTLFGPRGVCLAGADGPLLVADTGHHRVLIWNTVPSTDHAPADLVIGQTDFRREGRNGTREIGAATMNVPTGIAYGDGILAVADAWNHRVLLWHGLPRHSAQPADLVLGQQDLCSGSANRGGRATGADTLNWCYGVAIDAGRLFVADTGNRRVLVWDRMPDRNGMPADLVLGQRDFSQHDDHAGGAVGLMGMRWPHGLAAAGGALFVADAGSSRVMGWLSPPTASGAPCDLVLGQATPDVVDHNAGRPDPTIATQNMPYGVALQAGRLVVADTANSRLLGYALDELATGTAARFLAGQRGFAQKGDNRWGAPKRDSVSWPYAVAACGPTLAVADSGNDRVLLWDAV